MEVILSFISSVQISGALIFCHFEAHTSTHTQLCAHTHTRIWVHGNFNKGNKTLGDNISTSLYIEPHESGDER